MWGKIKSTLDTPPTVVLFLAITMALASVTYSLWVSRRRAEDVAAAYATIARIERERSDALRLNAENYASRLEVIRLVEYEQLREIEENYVNMLAQLVARHEDRVKDIYVRSDSRVRAYVESLDSAPADVNKIMEEWNARHTK